VILPRCTCGHPRKRHTRIVNGGQSGCESKPWCDCNFYQPKRSLRASVSKPIPRKSRPRKKVMPRCKHCGHPFRDHDPARDGSGSSGWTLCGRCRACPGYQPARGIRQRRRGAVAAVKRLADALWSQVVKLPQKCNIQGVYQHECKGPLEAMHMIPRTFAATRWLPINGACGCSAAHLYFTRRPELWSAVCLDLWGVEVFRELWSMARAMKPVDMEATVYKLREELAKVSA
jgi:hypothetical protein